jgi:hypothetical protein
LVNNQCTGLTSLVSVINLVSFDGGGVSDVDNIIETQFDGLGVDLGSIILNLENKPAR